MTQQELELPKGWVETELGDIITSVKGKKPKTLGEKNSKNKIPYITIKAFEKKIFEQFTNDESCPKCTENDLLMVWDGARSGLVGLGVSGIIGSTLVRLDCYENNSKFLWYFLQSKYQILNTKPRGSGTPHVDPTRLWNFKFLLPSLNEQKRIVSKIEELFSKIDSTKQSLEHTKLQLELYRQSLLKSAFEGKLTKEWKNDFQNFSTRDFLNEIFQSRKKVYEKKCKNAQNSKSRKPRKPDNLENLPLSTKFPLYKIPENWGWCSLNSLCSQITDGEHINPKYIEKGNLLLSAKNVRDGFVTYYEAHYISDGDFQKSLERCKPVKNDVLIVSVGATTGRVAIVNEEIPFAVLRSVLLVKPDSINSHYLLKYLQSPMAQKWLTTASGSTAQAHLYIRDTKNFPVPLCSSKEQEQIVSQIEQSFSLIENSQSIVNSTLQTLETMRMSVLKQAFQGKLVPQDPNDEPASILLEKIKNAQVAQKPKQRRVKNVK